MVGPASGGWGVGRVAAAADAFSPAGLRTCQTASLTVNWVPALLSEVMQIRRQLTVSCVMDNFFDFSVLIKMRSP